MNAVIKFFLTRTRLNYTIFTILLLLGFASYQTIPKDVYPPIKIDKVIIAGTYAGASAKTLNNMVITKLEKSLKSINGIEKTKAFIKNGEFNIVLTIEKGADKVSILNRAKDIVQLNKKDFPSDMDEPTVTIADFILPLISVTISSQSVDKQQLITIAEELKNDISSIPNIAKVTQYEDTTRVMEIILDNKKIEAYGIRKDLLFEEIKKLSYIYPMGKIEDKIEPIFISTINGSKNIQEYLNTTINIDNKVINLKDIATIKSRYKKSDVISKLNGKESVELGVSKNDKANAIELVKQIKQKVKTLNETHKNIKIGTFYDTSVLIENRLNTIISGIMFGLILVFVAMYILINKRVAFIVVMGIPTAILIGVAFLSFTSYSINMMTLIGALLILGVLVDDAVIIAENIQRHITLNPNRLQAAIDGTKEVLLPVTASSLTTLFAFIPMLMLSGEVGEFLKMIPIAIIILIIASILESFVFLPIHALHTLDKNDKELDWSKAINLYSKILHTFVAHKKKFLTVFILFVPFLTFTLIDSMRYQMFLDSDSDRVFVRGKFDMTHDLKMTYEKAQLIEKILLQNKEKYFFKSIAFTSGLRTDNELNIEIKPNVFEFNIELHTKVNENFVDSYITPILSFDFNDSEKIRTYSTGEIVLAVKKLLKTYEASELEELAIKQEGSGVVANDIEILVSTKDEKLLMQSLDEIKKELNKIEGIIFVDEDLKLKLNSYGESLGFSEATIASTITPLFLESTQTKGINSNGLFEILSYDANKNSLSTLKELKITIPNSTKKIALNEICDFIYTKNFETITKIDTKDTKMVVANVNNKIITSTETLNLLEPTFKMLIKNGVEIKLAGEQEQNDKMAEEMSYAFFISISLIFITLLVIFDSFRQTFLILSIIPFSILGALIGHIIVDINLSLFSAVGMLGLAGVVINDAIVMLDFIRKSKNLEDMMSRATLRLRPIFITSITTFLGLTTLMFFATGQSTILQPIAVSLGFGLLWGTILTLLYLPAMFAITHKFKSKTI